MEPPQQAPVQAPVQAPAQTSWADPLSVAAPAPRGPRGPGCRHRVGAAATAATRGRHPAARHAGRLAARAQRDADTLRYWDGNGWTQHVAKRS